MIDREHDLPITKQADVLCISRGSVYYLPRPMPEADLAIMRHLGGLHLEFPFAGSRMLRGLLAVDGCKIGRRHVKTLMKRMGLEALYRRPRSTKPEPSHKIYSYLLRGMAITRPNHVWAMDITYIPMERGFVYLAVVLDWATRRVLSWRLSITMEAAFCVETLEDALARHGKPEIFNTDQGSQFTGAAFTGVLASNAIAISMDGKGAWRDNVFIERLWRRVKYEEVYLRAYQSRRRRAKTDRIDGEALVRALLAYKRGEPRVCAMVRAPSPESEDSRRLSRERKTLTVERVQHVNRIKGLLFSQGVSGYEPLRRNRRQRLDELKTGDGRPLPPHLKAQISRELDRLELLIEQVKIVETERDALFAPAVKTGQLPAPQAMLADLKGIGAEFVAVLWSEGLCRSFTNRKQLGAYAGLAPTPWQSGSVAHEQGVSKAGNPRLRTTMIQLAWLWLRHQPQSALALWFKERVSHNGGRLKKTTIVALARKLLVALWKYVTAGIVIEGAVMKCTA